MTRSTNRPAKTKALLAIAFASNILTAPLPALCENAFDTSNSAIEFITKNAQATPEEKAYALLLLANCYVMSADSSGFEAQLMTNLAHPNIGGFFRFNSRGGASLTSMVKNLSCQSSSAHLRENNTFSLKELSSEKRTLADTAIKTALTLLKPDSKDSKTLNMYFIASCLSRMTGNVHNEQKCTKVLNDAIQACESNKSADSDQIKAVAPILNALANSLIPIQVPDNQAPVLTAVDTKGFSQCERLKLRAAAILDRLPSGDHDRRKVHRDLSLWYSLFGKDDKALKEKEELFKLVGVKDDSILYPHPGMCGHAVWWTIPKKVSFEEKCGMG